jgi:hypothetical protein
MKTFLRWVFIIVVSVGVLVSLFYAEEDWRGWHAWQKFKREWEAKGKKFDLSSIVPSTVPDDQNFALTPVVFTSYGNMLTRDGKAIPYEQRDTDFVNRLKMPIDFNGDGPTNAIGNWQNGSKSDLQAWQNYYRKLAAITNFFPASLQPQTPAQGVLLALSK